MAFGFRFDDTPENFRLAGCVSDKFCLPNAPPSASSSDDAFGHAVYRQALGHDLVFQFTAPILISHATDSRPSKRVPLSSGDAFSHYNQASLQQRLFRHPDALHIDDINCAFSQPVSVCTQLNTSSEPINALYATSQGKLVVLETRLWRNPKAWRTVVRQILDNPKKLTRLTYEGLHPEDTLRLNPSIQTRVQHHFADLSEDKTVPVLNAPISISSH